jgi:hypothetical protein
VLYDPQRHEQLSKTAWNESAARAAITEIVADTEAHFDSAQFWPMHPREGAPEVAKGLWFGAAGVIWALRYLAECGAVQGNFDCADAISRVAVRFAAEEDPQTYAGSFLMGEIGIALLHWRLTRESTVADRLFHLLEHNAEQATDELMWGAPGAALAASFMWEASGEERWREVFLRKVEELWARWKYRPEYDCHLWRQRLYQPEARIFLGSVHGFSGNACVMLRAASMLSEQRREELYDRIVRALVKTAHLEGDFANWLALADMTPSEPQQQSSWLVQWCHGAPGMLGPLSALPVGRDARMEALFLAGGELTFAAGPLTKGPNLCHGTSGNGLLFLQLHRRTGDEKWLDRARAFAMHGIAQYRQLKNRHGQGWHSLWTGDLGLAIYLWECITIEAGFPTMDFF